METKKIQTEVTNFCRCEIVRLDAIVLKNIIHFSTENISHVILVMDYFSKIGTLYATKEQTL